MAVVRPGLWAPVQKHYTLKVYTRIVWSEERQKFECHAKEAKVHPQLL